MRGLLLALSACAPLPEPVSPDEVLSLTVCPEGDLCELEADGASAVAVSACALADPPRVDPLDLSLHLSSGAWLAGGATLSASVVEDPCLRAVFTPSTDAPFVIVEAELAGMRAEERVWLSPAAIGALTLSPTPSALSDEPFQQLTLTLLAEGPSGGPVSEGTRYEVDVIEIIPETAEAVAWPDEGFLDDGGAAVDLTVAGAPESLRLRVTVTPPAWPDAPAPPPAFTREVELLQGL